MIKIAHLLYYCAKSTSVLMINLKYLTTNRYNKTIKQLYDKAIIKKCLNGVIITITILNLSLIIIIHWFDGLLSYWY